MTNWPVRVEGKFFWEGEKKLYAKGITYGPFAPNEQGEHFPSPDQARRDFQQITELGANVIRVYYVPPAWILDLAAELGLKLWVDIPWQSHLCFSDSPALRREASEAVRQAVRTTKGHPGIFAYSVANEISPEIVRWSGTRKVERFIDDLIEVAKSENPECLCTFTSYPPTEFLLPANADFMSFNVYLHEQSPFENYLSRLQSIADAKPLVLAEFGIDSIREGEARRREILRWTVESAFRCGLAGTVLFSYTDDWCRGGLQIEDWGFGLTTRARVPKESYYAVQEAYRRAPYALVERKPKVSVVVASYNGARTLKTCLDSLLGLNYPNYEVILVDDGSTDDTLDIAKNYSSTRYIRQSNQGLSAARNAGIAAATGEIVAFTDSDCRADPDWLHYLVSDLLRAGEGFVGIGGHNFLPPEDSAVAAAVLASPGGPAHVMLTDQEAEHIPGCNMAFYKWALVEIRGFDLQFHAAGDDVDVCWRLQDRRYKLAFSPAGFVWHYRRSTMRAYLKQQAGYGEAEALLMQKHPERFNSVGGSLWKGRIYSLGKAGVVLQDPIIYHGVFASGFFQCLYTPQPALPLMLCTYLAFHGFVSLPLILAALYFPVLLPLAVAAPAASLFVAVWAATQAHVPEPKRRVWSKPLIALMFLLQPIVRGWKRTRYRFFVRRKPLGTGVAPYYSLSDDPSAFATRAFWTQGGKDRYAFLQDVVRKLQEHCSARVDSGWGEHDVEIIGSAWSRLLLTTATEDLAQQRRLYRCRLEGKWTARAKLLFSLLIAAVLISAAVAASLYPWVWLSVIVAPVFYWFVEDDQLQWKQHAMAVLDKAAQGCEWTMLPSNPVHEPNAK